MKHKLSIGILLTLAATGWLLGHGIQVEIKKLSPMILLYSGYSQASPVKDGAVTIFAPDGEKYQSGRTDQKGNFSFNPDRSGSWKFIVDDETGHKKEVEIDISEDFFNAEIPDIPAAAPVQNPAVFCSLPFYLKLLLGLALIFGIFGLFAIFKTRKVKS